MFRISILLVEDSMRQAKAIKTRLELDGNKVIHSRLGADALSLFKEGVRPALVLIDVDLEKEGFGFEVLQEAAALGIPGIILTGRTTISEDKLKTSVEGGLAYIHKGDDPEILSNTVKNLLGLLAGGKNEYVLSPDLVVDFKGYEVRYKEKRIPMTKTVRTLFMILLNPEQVPIPREDVGVGLWGYYDDSRSANTLGVTMRRFTKFLEENDLPFSVSKNRGRRTNRTYQLLNEGTSNDNE